MHNPASSPQAPIALRVDRWLRTLPAIPLAIIIALAGELVPFLLQPLVRVLERTSGPPANLFDMTGSRWQLVFWLAVVTPLWETLVFQTWALKLARAMPWSRGDWAACLLSAAFFGLAHFTGPVYALLAFVAGLVFAYGYLVAGPSGRRAFGVVALAHAIHNLVAIALQLAA